MRFIKQSYNYITSIVKTLIVLALFAFAYYWFLYLPDKTAKSKSSFKGREIMITKIDSFTENGQTIIVYQLDNNKEKTFQLVKK